MADDLAQKTRLLVNTLYNETIAGRLSWYVGDYSNTIESKVSANIIQLTQFSNDYDDEVFYVLFVKDKAGNVKDRIDETTLSVKSASASLSTDDHEAVNRLARLYFEGKRRALGAGETLDEILGTFGVKP